MEPKNKSRRGKAGPFVVNVELEDGSPGRVYATEGNNDRGKFYVITETKDGRGSAFRIVLTKDQLLVAYATLKPSDLDLFTATLRKGIFVQTSLNHLKGRDNGE